MKLKFCFVSEEAKKIYNNQPPQYESEFASGFDLRIRAYDYGGVCGQKTRIDPAIDFFYTGRRYLISTGIKIALPVDTINNKLTELQIRSRSGLALKHGLCVLNSPGTIDNDYRGELGVILYNAGYDAYRIKLGDRIAQGVLNPLCQAEFEEVSLEEFNKLSTDRGAGGFGSTGV